MKVPPSGDWTYTFRDESSRVSTEYSGANQSRDNVFLGNLLVASYANSAVSGNGPVWTFYASDHLGTPRLITDISGAMVESRKYWPYGEDATTQGTVQRLRFASMERDTEGSRYYDHARSHEFNLGRFLSPDILSGVPTAPQSWNRYAYVLANPLLYIDPTGLTQQCTNDHCTDEVTVSASAEDEGLEDFFWFSLFLRNLHMFAGGVDSGRSETDKAAAALKNQAQSPCRDSFDKAEDAIYNFFDSLPPVELNLSIPVVQFFPAVSLGFDINLTANWGHSLDFYGGAGLILGGSGSVSTDPGLTWDKRVSGNGGRGFVTRASGTFVPPGSVVGVAGSFTGNYRGSETAGGIVVGQGISGAVTGGWKHSFFKTAGHVRCQ